MHFKTADAGDFDIAFHFIQKLWDYNTYDRETTLNIYLEVLSDPNSFAFFLIDNDVYCGFCHGVYYNTFWMSGLTCYISALITDETARGKGYGRLLMDHARELAKSAGCNCITLDSGLKRTAAHQFYEHYGFEKGCYGFELTF